MGTPALEKNSDAVFVGIIIPSTKMTSWRAAAVLWRSISGATASETASCGETGELS